MAQKTNSTETATAAVESLYTVEELAAVAKDVFKASPDIVTAALRLKGVKKTTLKEAQRIVEAFRKKEV